MLPSVLAPLAQGGKNPMLAIYKLAVAIPSLVVEQHCVAD